MIKTIEENGSFECLKTSQYTSLNMGFEKFNPVQSRLVKEKLHTKNCNILVAWPTSTGKTVVAELVIEKALCDGKKIIYACPLKALAEEKVKRFRFLFPDKNIEIFSGDYRDFETRKLKAKNAHIAIVTTELLDSISRNKELLKNLINEASALIIDEFHILATERGAAVEGSLIRTTLSNKDLRLILLSATAPNAWKIGEWIHSLNGKETYIFESLYRPVKINWHKKIIKPVKPLAAWRGKTLIKIKEQVLFLLKKEPDAQILIFVWNKKDGTDLQNLLEKYNIPCLFHNASLSLKKRLDYENKFENKKIKVLISTTTLAWGRNTSARHVFIFGDKRGLKHVPGWDVIQMGGRAGRTGLTSKGDVWWYISDENFANKVLNNPPKIISSLTSPRRLAFQILGEMPYKGKILLEDILVWFKRTLVSKQKMEYENINTLNNALDILINKTKCVKINENTLQLTTRGKIARRFYLDPYELNSWCVTFQKLKNMGLENFTNPAVAFSLFMAHGSVQDGMFVSKEEVKEIWNCQDKIFQTCLAKDIFLDDVHVFLTSQAIEWYKKNLVSPGRKVYPHPKIRSFLYDLERIGLACSCIAKEIKQMEQAGDEIQKMSIILRYGAPVEAYDLLKIRGIGTVRAKKLLNSGIKNKEMLLERLRQKKDREKILEILPENVLSLLPGRGGYQEW